MRKIERLPQHDLLRADALQVFGLSWLAGDGDDVIASLGEDLGRHRSHAARCAGDRDATLIGLEAVVLHPMNRERRRQAGGAECHRVEGGHAFGPSDNPIGGHAHELGVAAVVGNAHVVAGDDHFVAALPAGVVRALDRTRHVDAGDGRILAHDLAGAVVRERVLVVDGRILGLDDDVAGVELVDGHLDKTARHIIVVLKRTVCLELLHGTLLLFLN